MTSNAPWLIEVNIRSAMKSTVALIFLMAVSALPAAASHPDFTLQQDAAGGYLSWSGHTVVLDFDAPVPHDDHIVEDARTGSYDIGLHWNTKPNPRTGEILTATYFWRVAKSDLKGRSFVFSVKRVSPDAIIFILHPKDNPKEIMQSPICRLEKGFLGLTGDISKHVTKLKSGELDSAEKEKRR